MADEASQKTKLQNTREAVRALPAVKVPHPFQGFVDFIREQGVVGLAIGLVLGTQVKTLVDQIVASFLNPLIGLLLPGTGALDQKKFALTIRQNTQDFMYGAFIAELLSFIVIAALIFLVVKQLKLDKLDKKKA